MARIPTALRSAAGRVPTQGGRAPRPASGFTFGEDGDALDLAATEVSLSAGPSTVREEERASTDAGMPAGCDRQLTLDDVADGDELADGVDLRVVRPRAARGRELSRSRRWRA